MNNKICPHCGYEFEASTNLEDEKAKPHEGDISFCIKCGGVSEFGEGTMIPMKLDDLKGETLIEILKIRKAWLETKNLNVGTRGRRWR